MPVGDRTPPTATNFQQVEGTEKYWFDSDGDGLNDSYLIHEEDANKEQQRIREVSGGASHTHTSGSDTANFERIIREMKAKPESEGHKADSPSNPVESGSTDYGAPDLEASDFMDRETGENLPYETVVDNLMKKFPNSERSEIELLVSTEMPKFQGVSAEEKGFVSEERGFAEKEAEAGRGFAERQAGLGLESAKRGLKGDIYGLQKQAGQVGAQMRGAYGGMGGGMRASIGGQAAMAKGFETAYEGYGGAKDAYSLSMDRAKFGEDIAMEKAEFGERKALYGLGQTAIEQYESQLGQFAGAEQFKLKQGGRVPSKKTFLDVLTRLPNAGGS